MVFKRHSQRGRIGHKKKVERVAAEGFGQRMNFDQQIIMQTAEPDRFGVVAVKPREMGNSAGAGTGNDSVAAQGLAGIATRAQPDGEELPEYGRLSW